MRLSRVVPAVALAFALFAPSISLVAASHGASATLLSPAPGAAIRVDASVVIQVSGFHGSAIQGYLMLDGAWAGSLPMMAIVPGNTTTVTVGLNATGFAPGPYSLSAHVFSGNDAPVNTPAVAITLDTPPAVAASGKYDLDERRLRVTATVEDESAPAVELRAGTAKVNASFVGTHEFVLPLTRSPGNYTAQLSAVDALGQNTTLAVPYTVHDRAADIRIIEITYLMADRLRVVVAASDPDGLRRVDADTTLGGGRHLKYDNETDTWSAELRINASLGDHAGTIQTRDAHEGTTNVSFAFSIGGPREVLFERTIATDKGAYMDVINLFLPRVHEGRVEVCLDGVCSGAPYWIGTQVEAIIRESLPFPGQPQPRVCTAPRLVATSCEFDIDNAAGWNLDLAWQQVGYLEVTVRVTGIRV